MQNSLRYGLLGGAVLAVAGGIAVMAFSGPGSPRTPLPEMRTGLNAPANNQSRGGGAKFFRDYDLDRDGQVTRAEFEQTSNQRFVDASGGSDAVTVVQFAAAAAKDLRNRSDAAFRIVDWNGDGKVSMDEFFVSARGEFQKLDRDAKGEVSCVRQTPPKTADAQNRGRRGGSRGAQSLGAFCKENDANVDGVVTHAEFDAAMHQKFAVAAGTVKELSPDAYYGLELARFKDATSRQFQRLDKNSDAKVTKDEFVARDTKTFARLDKNEDGIVTKKEAASSRRSKSAQG